MRRTVKVTKCGMVCVSHLLFLGLVLSGSLLGSGCNRNSCPDWNQVSQNQSSGTGNSTPSAVKATNDLIVYLDTSGSMAGYINRDGQTIFGKTLRELRVASGTFAGNTDIRVAVRHIGSDVGPTMPDMELSRSSQDPSVFRAGETDLAGAISSFRGSPERSRQESPAKDAASHGGTAEPEPALPARFHVLITDGVQSTRQRSEAQSCNAGSDQFCVRQKIGELLRAGWGGCVLAVRADFHGKVYSEVSGATISYDSKADDVGSYRPFYLYVFSPDPASLDSLINSLKERLRPLAPGGESIRELNLSFPYVTGDAVFDLNVPKESRDAVKRVKDRGGPPDRFTIHVDVDETVKSGPRPFSILVKVPWSVHGLDTASSSELSKLLNWKVVPINPANDVKGARFPEITLTESQADGTDGISLQARVAFQPGTAEPSCRVYRLEGRLTFNQATPAWIQSWSTNLDTTREAGNRTFNLETALLGLWNNSTAKDEVVAEAYLRVGP